ncbi:MAG: threonine synthase [Candidatus Firestonebacteria bacterium RIFOXYC2_FULL_39_67]|nr:MAG: threonine synthase [Candidatus Firestonebacteria bacterium RIFOXYD2_FULL_39_29]OGF53242.1 MAG: threonine synthase [Candidatus Firestonebacteria bacterium RifOxyC12_full_39_7]OGF55808.1 MAG: threonine synthase [Candidatus Firestonebacteria bacterium RIFOXYC2_FULL_39_67]
MKEINIYKGLIDTWRKYLPVTKKTPVISLCEGNTPLIRAFNLERKISKDIELYLKFEGMNPTGSFKDRGMTMAISKAKEEGSKAVICASTGNTSASAAAYAARAGMKCVVILPAGKIALGKLTQALMHGATVLAVDGNFDDALNVVKEISSKYPITLVNSINPYRIEGQKTGAFEICENFVPDFHAIPVGNAGNITAYWKGYKEFRAVGRINRTPVMLGFQAEGAAPIVRGYPVEKPETIATAIRIGNPASWKQAEAARDESKGLIDMVSDNEIVAAYKILAATEGVFCEPASAASIAGVYKLAGKKYFSKKAGTKKARVVCILTGHGLKDPDRAIKVSKPPITVKPSIKEIMKHISL